MWLIIIYYTLLNLLNAKFQNILEIPIHNNYLELSLGAPSQITNYSINLQTQFLNTNSHYFNISNSSSLVKIESNNNTILPKDYESYSEYVHVRLKTGTLLILPKLHFIYTENTNSLFYPNIGFSYKIYEHYSLIHRLYDSGFVSERNFGFSLNATYDSMMTVGGIPKQYKEKYPFVAKCDALDSVKWGCKMKNVFFNNIIYHNTAEFFFDIQKNKILAPKSFFVFLKTQIFHDYINKKICEFVTINLIQHFICECKSLENFPKISFYFSKELSISLEKNQIFDITNDRCYFSIYNNLKNDVWVFQLNFLNNTYINFDYDNKSVTFLSTYSLINNIIKKRYQLILLICITLVLAMNCILLRIDQIISFFQSKK